MSLNKKTLKEKVVHVNPHTYKHVCIHTSRHVDIIYIKTQLCILFDYIGLTFTILHFLDG